MHVIFELGLAVGYFDSAKNLHHHFHVSLVFYLCDFVSFDTTSVDNPWLGHSS
jgi:hypothetical protein